MLWVYVPTGVGGIILTYLLFVSRLVPRAIALLGLVGYVLLTIGVPLDLLGVLDMSAGCRTPPGGPRRAVRAGVPPDLADREGLQRPALRLAGDDLTAMRPTSTLSPVADLDAVEARIWALLEPQRARARGRDHLRHPLAALARIRWSRLLRGGEAERPQGQPVRDRRGDLA